MKYLKAALFAAGAAIATMTVQAAPADPRVTVRVDPVENNEAVTLSRLATSKKNLALDTLAAYQFTITNGTTNTLNRVFLSGIATNVGGADKVLFDSSIPSVCSVGTAPDKVTCSLPSLAPGTTSAPLIVVFRAPTNGQQIRFAWTAGGDEGNGGGNGCCNQSGFATTTLIDPTTDVTYKYSATTFVKPGGGKVFTGDEAITTSADGWSTTVEVPAFTSLPYTLATILEEPSSSCPTYALADGCFASKLTIPGSFAMLAISFQWDKSFFNLGNTKPESVKLYYEGSNPLIEYPIEVRSCSEDAVTYGAAPTLGRPCMPVPPKLLRSQDTPVKDSWGDLLIRANALDNGKYYN